MRRALVIVVLVLAAALPGTILHVPDGRLRNHPVPIFGIAYGNTLIGMNPARLGQALDDAVAVGATAARTDIDWNDVQPDSATEFSWSRVDRVVAEASRRRLVLIVVLVGTPPWARIEGCADAFCAPADPARFAAFAGAAASRYGSDRVLAWEVWNEPNTAGFWSPEPDPARYATLLRLTADAIRGADPGATVLLGGLASVDDGDGALAESTFLGAVGRDGGIGAVDGVAFHPYTYPQLASEARTDASGPWGRMDGSADELRAALSRQGAPQLPIWITEFGAPTGGPGAASDGATPVPTDVTHVTEAQQARIAADVVPTVAADPTVAALVWYSDRDLSGDTSSNLNFYGLRRADGSRKPAWDSLRRAVEGVSKPS